MSAIQPKDYNISNSTIDGKQAKKYIGYLEKIALNLINDSKEVSAKNREGLKSLVKKIVTEADVELGKKSLTPFDVLSNTITKIKDLAHVHLKFTPLIQTNDLRTVETIDNELMELGKTFYKSGKKMSYIEVIEILSSVIKNKNDLDSLKKNPTSTKQLLKSINLEKDVLTKISQKFPNIRSENEVYKFIESSLKQNIDIQERRIELLKQKEALTNPRIKQAKLETELKDILEKIKQNETTRKLSLARINKLASNSHVGIFLRNNDSYKKLKTASNKEEITALTKQFKKDILRLDLRVILPEISDNEKENLKKDLVGLVTEKEDYSKLLQELESLKKQENAIREKLKT